MALFSKIDAALLFLLKRHLRFTIFFTFMAVIIEYTGKLARKKVYSTFEFNKGCSQPFVIL